MDHVVLAGTSAGGHLAALLVQRMLPPGSLQPSSSSYSCLGSLRCFFPAVFFMLMKGHPLRRESSHLPIRGMLLFYPALDPKDSKKHLALRKKQSL